MYKSIENFISPTNKVCKNCAEEIKFDAKLCNHCVSFQDWRSNFQFGTVVLFLLVALVSVLSIALPALIASLIPNNSRLEFTVQGSSKDTVFVLVSNLGKRPGSIAHVALFLDEEAEIVLNLDPFSHNIKIIEPEKTILIEYKFVRRVIDGRLKG